MIKCKLRDQLLTQPPAQMLGAGGSGVLLGALGYLELNVQGYPFPGWSTAEDRHALAEHLLPVVRGLSPYRWMIDAEMAELSREEKLLLLERRQISGAMAARGDGVHVLINDTQDTECYINDEEHLLIKTFFPGEQGTDAAYASMTKLLAEVESKLDVARSDIFGYMMSDPTKSGSPIFFSMLVHLPGLRITKFIPQVRHALDEMGFLLEPFYSPLDATTHDPSDLYLMHSPVVMASRLDAMQKDMNDVAAHLCEQELKARNSLVDSPKEAVHVIKNTLQSVKALTEPKTLKYNQMLSALSMLRFGLSTGLLHTGFNAEEAAARLGRAYAETAPAHLAYLCDLSTQRARRKARASYTQQLTKEILKSID